MATSIMLVACGGAVSDPTAEALQEQACGEPFKGPSWGTVTMTPGNPVTLAFSGPGLLVLAGPSSLANDVGYPTRGQFSSVRQAEGSGLVVGSVR
jgi:hypothetical protein